MQELDWAPVKGVGNNDSNSSEVMQHMQHLALFRDLSPTQLEKASLVMQCQPLDVGEIVVAENQMGDMIYFLIEGSVKILVRRGLEEVVIGLRGKGEIIGELSLLDGGARSATVITQTPCTICRMSRENFWQVLWPMPPIPYNLSCILTERVRRLTSKVQSMATLDVRGRLSYQIVLLVEEHAHQLPGGAYQIPFTITQSELALMIGTSRVQVSNTFTSWRQQRLITTKRGHITVFDLNAFREMFPADIFPTSFATGHNANFVNPFGV